MGRRRRTAKRKTRKGGEVEEMANFGIFLQLSILCSFTVMAYGYGYNRATNANAIANGGGGGNTNANAIANRGYYNRGYSGYNRGYSGYNRGYSGYNRAFPPPPSGPGPGTSPNRAFPPPPSNPGPGTDPWDYQFPPIGTLPDKKKKKRH